MLQLHVSDTTPCPRLPVRCTGWWDVILHHVCLTASPRELIKSPWKLPSPHNSGVGSRLKKKKKLASLRRTVGDSTYCTRVTDRSNGTEKQWTPCQSYVSARPTLVTSFIIRRARAICLRAIPKPALGGGGVCVCVYFVSRCVYIIAFM